jgi:NAD(P)-dependent dehydrogenase (short-subunit alcohol dehydrogenase family)
MLDSNRLDGKVALVTCAGGEIGAATVKLMIARGTRIVAVDRDRGTLQKLATGLEHGQDLIAVEGDVTDEGSVTAFVARAREAAGRIDIFFNNAGIEGRSVRSPNIRWPTFAAFSTSMWLGCSSD